MPIAVHGLQMEPSFISCPENKSCQYCTRKLIADFREKNGEHCTLSDKMKASAGMCKIQRDKVSEWPLFPCSMASQWLSDILYGKSALVKKYHLAGQKCYWCPDPKLIEMNPRERATEWCFCKVLIGFGWRSKGATFVGDVYLLCFFSFFLSLTCWVW